MGRRHLKELDQDIREHIEHEIEDNIARGMSPDEAKQAALRKFGNILRIKEDTRAVWHSVWIDQFVQDLHYAVRTLRRDAGFSLAVVLTLAIAIGVNTAIFSVLNTLLLRPLPYPDSDRLVAYTTVSPAQRFKPGIEGADFAEWRTQAKSFDQMAGYQYQDATVSGAGKASRVRTAAITGDFWALTGVRPAHGRLFAPDEPPGSIVISHKLFQTQFGGNPQVIGSAVSLDGRQLTLIGILPADFRFLLPQERPGFAFADMDAFVASPPLIRSEKNRLFVIGKLKPGIPIETALAELKAIQTRTLQLYPDRWFAGVEGMLLAPLQKRLAGQASHALIVLQAAGIFVLLIACANIANLLLARASARQREIAIRTAIGAGAGRIFRQFLSEGLVLAVLGGSTGLLTGKWALILMARFESHAIPRLSEVQIDWRVLAFTVAVSLASAMFFCLGPAAVLLKTNLQEALKDRGANSSGRFGRLKIQRYLVAAEVALCIVLLTGAGLMVKSFWRMYAASPGFEPANTLMMQVALSGNEYRDKTRQVSYVDELLRRIESLPGVHAAGIADRQVYLLQSKDPAVPNIVDQFQESIVSPRYFSAIGMQLVRGRWLMDTDSPDATVINETLARRVFGDRDPIGENITRLGRPIRVVGVAANLRYSKLDADPLPEIYRGYRQNLGGRPTISVVVRVTGDPLGFAATARSQVSDIDTAEPVYNVQSLEQVLTESIAPRRFNFFLLGTFAIAAVIMAVVGIYGVIAYSVMQRTHEIGVRMALGARHGQIAGMVVRQGMQIALSGIAAGILAAFWLTRLMKSLLYGVQPGDLPTFATVTAALAATALVVCSIPALRAARVDPMIALRHE